MKKWKKQLKKEIYSLNYQINDLYEMIQMRDKILKGYDDRFTSAFNLIRSLERGEKSTIEDLDRFEEQLRKIERTLINGA
ncbi:hypothetical protein DLD82_10805 [Methanospirillum stamsii]|uniref:Uncharacterized protein n=2 Tax=Methanospirillum stamsii TaxID=1277351 RepID=A0A2V2NA44_9EURY|nr:hypothetical protein DLD82_10805 [Methanospirillum stamsii]